MEHALASIEIRKENAAPALELFFGFEALAWVEKARQNSIGFQKALAETQQYFTQLSPEDQKWCAESLHKLQGAFIDTEGR